jgi:hypothetical protein
MANGHSQETILTYSIRKIDMFVEMARWREREKLHSLTIAMRQSQGTDEKKWKAYMDALLPEEGK